MALLNSLKRLGNVVTNKLSEKIDNLSDRIEQGPTVKQSPESKADVKENNIDEVIPQPDNSQAEHYMGSENIENVEQALEEEMAQPLTPWRVFNINKGLNGSITTKLISPEGIERTHKGYIADYNCTVML